MSDCESAVRGFLTTLDVDLGADGADLLAKGSLDSLVLVELLYFIEQKFSVRIDVEHLDLDDFRTIERICRFIDAARAR